MGYNHLRVYQAALELRKEVDPILRELRDNDDKEVANAAKHLDEAVDSVRNNISEGNDSIYPRKRVSFFDISNGSTGEARSSLESLADREAVSRKRVYRAIGLTFVISKMLTKLMGGQQD